MITISWSVLDPWSRGDKEVAMKNWLHLKVARDKKSLKALWAGKQGHHLVATKKLRPLPEMMDGIWENRELGQGVYTFRVNDFLQFKGIIDYSEKDWFVDWKFGKTPAGSINKMQIYTYSLLLDRNGIPNKYGKVVKLVKKKTDVEVEDMVTYIMNDQKREEAFNFIETFGSEFYHDLEVCGYI